MKISIVTATYNRETLLPTLYESLVKNYETCSTFEWIIMDDGSKDGTKKLVTKWQKSSSFPIKYYFQENSGKMAAINHAMEYVSGDIVIEIDSDDYLVEGALCKVIKDYEELTDENIYGIIYKRTLGNKDIRVAKGMHNTIIRLFDIHNTYGYSFDMNLTFKADIRKKYQYPLEKDEKFITEARLYYKMDQEFDGLLFKDEAIVVGEYLEDGYSKNIEKMFKSYPYGYYAYFKECLGYTHSKTLFSKRLYFIKHYILFSFLTKKTKVECLKGIKGFNKLLLLLLVIPGYWKARKY